MLHRMKTMTNPRIAIYTAVFGNYDPIKTQIAQNFPVDFICFTDQKIEHPNWQIITVPAEDNPRQQAKYYKLIPHHVMVLRHYDCLIWIDGSFQIERADFAEWVISAIGDSGWAMFPHADLKCIYEEADQMADTIKYADAPIRQQVDFYRSDNYPEQNGLYACGLIARDMKNKQWHIICDDWWQENKTHSLRDQISLPYVLWKNKGSIDIIEAALYDNPFFTIQNDHRKKEYDPVIMPLV